VKYVFLFEWNFVDMERINELWIEVLKERESGSDRWPKILFEPHYFEADIGKKSRDMRGFFIFETEDPVHLLNERMQFVPYMDVNFIPITPNRFISEQWLATKKEVFRPFLKKE